MIKTALIFTALASVFIATQSSAKERIDPFDGIPHAVIEVHGKMYSFPIGVDMSGNDRTNDVYYLKKALGGDNDARDIFLRGKDKREFFIGRENPKWLIVTKDDINVVEY